MPFDVYPLRDYVAPGENMLVLNGVARPACSTSTFNNSADALDPVFLATGCPNVRFCYCDPVCPRPAAEFLTHLLKDSAAPALVVIPNLKS